MKKSSLAILIAIILALVGFGLYFTKSSEQSSVEQAQAERLKAIEAELAALNAASETAEKERLEALEQSRIAAEAKRMAEARAAKEEQEKAELVRQLNERLAAEAEERRQAELAQKELETALESLRRAQAEAQAQLTELEKERGESAPDAESLRDKLARQEAELASLAQENNTLKERTQLLEQRQVATEESIIKAGGRIEIPYPEIRSPNYKRREALYFKERVSGSARD